MAKYQQLNMAMSEFGEQIVERAKEIDVNLDQPHLKQFLLEKFPEKQIDS